MRRLRYVRKSYYKKSLGSGRVSIIRNLEVVRYSEVANVLIVYKISWYIAGCSLYGHCPLLGVSLIRGFTVYKIYIVELALYSHYSIQTSDHGVD